MMAELNEFDAHTIARNVRYTTPLYFGYRLLLVTFNSSRYSAVSSRKRLKWENTIQVVWWRRFKITWIGSSGRDLSFFIQ